MASRCLYTGITPMNNYICNKCSLFLSACIPVASIDGLALGSECDIYLCEGCPVAECYFNLY